MASVLLYRFKADLAAFAAIAVGEVRPTAARPSHGNVGGIAAACLGMERDDLGLPFLMDAFRSVVVHGPRGSGRGGRADQSPMVDFHTVQTPTNVAVRARVKASGSPPSTRMEELGCGEPYTSVTTRSYMADVDMLVGMVFRDGDLARRCAEAMRRPAFIPYAGRKCCAFSAPFDPVVSTGSTLAEAITAHPGSTAVGPDVSWDGRIDLEEPGLTKGLRPLTTTERRDVPSCDGRRTFRLRPEVIGRREVEVAREMAGEAEVDPWFEGMTR